MATVVLIEDEPGIADFVERGLRDGGLQVHCARDGDSGLALALQQAVDLVVLDLTLPRRSGEAILRDLSDQRPGLPVIVLTARGELQDRVAGLRAGAVDYIVKPFALAELEARIEAQLRSARRAPTTALHHGELTIDLLTRTVSAADRKLHLSATELELLGYFVRHSGIVLTRRQILQAVWGYRHDPATNVVDVYVGYLRRKLVDGERALLTITALRSRGYRLEPAP